MSGAGRLTVRLNQQQLDRLQERCQQAGLDVSHVVRQALDAFLANGQGVAGSGSAPRRLAPPDEVIRLTPPYLAYGKGDLRQERKRLFAELVAVAFVCQKHYSHTPGMVDGCQGLLQLCRFFGLE